MGQFSYWIRRALDKTIFRAADPLDRLLTTKKHILEEAERFGIKQIVSDWLSNPENLKLIKGHFESFEKAIIYAAEGGIGEIVVQWLSDQKNAELAAKDWDPFSWVVSEVVKGGIGRIAFKWLSDQKNAELAAKNWEGFHDTISQANKHGLGEALFVYFPLKDLRTGKINVEIASQDWFAFEKKVKNSKFRDILLNSTHFAGVYAWFERNGLKLSYPEKKYLFSILENRRRLNKSLRHSAHQILRYLPTLRKLLAGLKNVKSTDFILKHGLFYIAVSPLPPEKFKHFVDSLESSKKRVREMNTLGINTEVWNNYKQEKKVVIAGKKEQEITIGDIQKASEHFWKCLKKRPTEKKLRQEATLIQEYAKKHALPELTEDSKKEYLQIILRYYAEKDNWKILSREITGKYKELEKGVWDLLERFEVVGTIIKIGVSTWERKLPDDIYISDVCGDCTSTSGTYSEAGSTRLADNGYSILKISSINGKKAKHVGNIYCTAYTADRISCLFVDGMEVTQTFKYGSNEVADTLLGFVREYAQECRFQAVFMNSYPSNIGWIKNFVQRKYDIRRVALHKIGGNTHLTELGLQEEEMMSEGSVEVLEII